jgi:hypothetical protein
MRAFALALAFAARAWAACPSYTASSPANTHNCGFDAVPGSNPTTTEWQPIFSLVAAGPTSWGSAGPSVSAIPSGCAAPTQVPAIFPCELLKAIAMNESGWTQFCVPTTPADQVGMPSQTIIAFDCGYGIAQVTSGMHKGDTAAFDQTQVAADPTYNLATGAQILAGKWRGAHCVGDRNPEVIEDWYTATWAYNGLAYSNNPNNPAYDAMRPVCDPNQGCPNRPYQERVFGWVEHPPTAAHWTAVALAYPNRGDIPNVSTGVQMVSDLPEPDCAGPTDCVNHRSVHTTACAPTPTPTPSPTTTPTPTPEPSDLGVGFPGDGGAKSGCDCDFTPSTAAPSALIFLALFALFRASKRRS